MWKKAAFSGENPKKAMWESFYSLPEDQQKALLHEAEQKVGKTPSEFLHPLAQKPAVSETAPASSEDSAMLAEIEQAKQKKLAEQKPLADLAEALGMTKQAGGGYSAHWKSGEKEQFVSVKLINKNGEKKYWVTSSAKFVDLHGDMNSAPGADEYVDSLASAKHLIVGLMGKDHAPRPERNHALRRRSAARQAGARTLQA